MTLQEFFKCIFVDGRGWICLAKISRTNGTGFVQTFFRYPDQMLEIEQYVEDNNVYGNDLYFSVNLFSKPQRSKEFALPMYILYADLDLCHPRNLGKFGEPRPSLVLQTSQDKWQGYWILKEKITAAQAEELSHQIAVAYKDMGCDQSGWDTTQILRIPGTKNWKFLLEEDD